MGKKTQKYMAEIETTLAKLSDAGQTVPVQLNIMLGLAKDVAKAAAKCATAETASTEALAAIEETKGHFETSRAALIRNFQNWKKEVTTAQGLERMLKAFIDEKEKKKLVQRKSLPKLATMEKRLAEAVKLNTECLDFTERKLRSDGYL